MNNKRNQADIVYLTNLAASCIAEKRFDDAIDNVINILNIDNINVDALYILASAYMHKDDFAKAIFYIEKVLAIDELYVGAYIVLAYVYKKQLKINEEIELLKTVISLIVAEQNNNKDDTLYHKSLVEAWSLLGSAYTLINETIKAVEAFIECSLLEKNEQQKLVEYSNALFTANYSEKLSATEKYSLHLKYNDFFSDIKQFEHNFKVNKKKIRIGYISPDFRQHAVSYFSYTMLANFNRNVFEVFCYAKGLADDITFKLKAVVDKWQNVDNLEYEDIAKLIYADNIDILVDLAGHTAHSLLPVLAYKPAPLQISGIGYFNTTGLKTVDYFLTDINCDPIGKNDEFFSEQLLSLEHSHFCYSPLIDMGAVSTLPALKNNYITFGSFNNFNKVTDEMLVVWNSILEKVPKSKLVLKSKIFNSVDGIKFVVDKMNKLAMPIERIDLRGFSSDYLAQYADIDIALDTYPYQGGATTCEALYMGVPVLTLVGESHGSRFGYSLLKNAGLEELICYSSAEYIDKAVVLANNIALLQELRASLRGLLQNSSLMNAKQYMMELEEKYCFVYKELINKEDKVVKNSINYNDITRYLNEGNYTKAIVLLRNYLNTNSNDAQALCDIVSCYIELNDLNSAQAYCEYLSELTPNASSVLFLKARLSYMSGEYESTVDNLTKLLVASNPANNQVLSLSYNLLGNTYKLLGDAKKSSKAYLAASNYSVDLNDKLIDYSNYLFNLNYLADISLAKLSTEHLKYNDFFKNIKLYQHDFKPKEKIRIGYISPDLRNHVVLNFSYTFFNDYDKSVFEVYCYAYGQEDDYSADIRSKVDNWRNITADSYAQIAELIYKDNIDILVDLAGHTKNNLLPVLAYKPAPLQVSGIGYFNTTGLKTVDYYFTDIYCENDGFNTQYFSEKMLILPQTQWCYQPLKNFPDINKKSDNYIVFGSFNNFTKTTDEILLLWKEILQKISHSKLLLKSSIFSNEDGVKQIIARLTKLGFDLEKIEFRGESVNYLAEYNEVDIALDTYPYVGGGTTCEALYMGTPVITLVGDRPGARFGYSILKNLGLDDCIAASKAEYIEKAVALATNIARLTYLQQQLRYMMEQSPLMNRKNYMKNIEAKYIDLYQENMKKTLQQAEIYDLKNKFKVAVQDQDYQKIATIGEILLNLQLLSTDNMYVLSNAYYQLKNYNKSICYGKKALLNNTKYDAETYLILAYAYKEKLCYFEAKEHCQKALLLLQEGSAVDKNYLSNVYQTLAYLQMVLGEVAFARNNYKKASELSGNLRDKLNNYSSYLMTLHYSDNLTADFIFQEHLKFNEFFAEIKAYSHKKNKITGKIKIGYISADFRQHVMFYFYHQLLACYDNSKFEVTCYCLNQPDVITEYIKTLVDHWRVLNNLEHNEAAKIIYQDKLDILIDLSGHSANNALGILAYKPAGIQISGLGYFNTTGLKAVDYFISDKYLEPTANQQYFTEQLLVLADSQFCYTGQSNIVESKEAPCKSNGYITFGSFNNYAKLSDDVLLLWLEILYRVPQAKLLIKTQVAANDSGVNFINERLEKLGFDLKRIILEPATRDYLNDYLKIDIALDTFPYPGGGTTCEALYMGVPVITLAGTSHGSRFGNSILQNAGFGELVAGNKEEYVNKAVMLTKDLELLDELHKNLRKIVLNSILMDEQTYVRGLEKKYIEIVRRNNN